MKKQTGDKSGECCLERLFTFHFRIDQLFQLCLLLQGLWSHLGGAGEADDDDADVIQAALQRETEHRQVRVWRIYSNWLLLYYISEGNYVLMYYVL